MPEVHPSNRGFSGIGNGFKQSLVVGAIRMPVGKQITLTFDVDLIDQETLLI